MIFSEAVTGIFAKENGQGLFFPREAAQENGGKTLSEPSPPNGNGGKPKLQVIK